MNARRIALCFALASFYALSGCTRKPDLARAEQEIRSADAQWVKAAATSGVDGWTAFYTDDATVLPPNEPTAIGKVAIHKAIAELYALPSASITWEPTRVEVASSGDTAYANGTYKLIFKDAKGQPAIDNGKFTEVWRKRADGTWKCALDMWSSDAPAPAA